jgi:hypothetical protein
MALALVLVLTLLSSLSSNASALQLTAAVVDSAVVLGTVLWWDVLGLPARVRRVTRRLGLAHRHPSGRIQPLRCRGVHRIARRHTRLTWRLPPGITLRDVLAQQDAIEQALDGEIVCWMERGRLVMEVLRERIPDLVDFATFYASPAPPGKLMIGLGRSHRRPLWTDLGPLPHLLVGGMTGGGKSVFLTQALTHLVLTHQPDQLRLLCIDLKGGIELALFATTPHSLGDVVTTVEGAAEALDSVRSEVDRRLQGLRNAGVRDIDAWADIGRPPWPRIVVVVDELAELTVRELGGNPSALAAQKVARGRLGEVARLGRALASTWSSAPSDPTPRPCPASSRPTWPAPSRSASTPRSTASFSWRTTAPPSSPIARVGPSGPTSASRNSRPSTSPLPRPSVSSPVALRSSQRKGRAL